MIVNSHNIEFGYELISLIPYANYLESIGQLEKTISGNDTECLYFFSPNHEINPEQRSWYNTPKCKDIPNIDIHKPFLRKDQFLAPDYRTKYANKKFKFEKETVIICNRHNTEWGKKPINFFSLYTLRQLFELLQDQYQVVYINIEGRPELYDNAPPEKLGDFELVKEYPKVINIHDLHQKNSKLSFNTLQLKLFANCKKYITMNGGHAILAAYFGGENIIMSKHGYPETREINEKVNSFYRWYHEFGNQRVVHVDNEKKLIERVKIQWIDKDPIVNILVRTSNRPLAFNKCIGHIQSQTYKNINVFVSIDSANDYTIKYPVYPVFVKPENNIPVIEDKSEYGKPFPYNLYLNSLQEKVKEGIIIYQDDDDMFHDKHVVQKIVDSYKKGNDLIFWKVKCGERIIPSQKNWMNVPFCCDISGIGFAFDSKYKGLATWEPYKRGDYRVAIKLYNSAKSIDWIDEILTETQNGQNGGNRKDIEKEGWFKSVENDFWFGNPEYIAKKIASGYFKSIDISEVPKELILQK